MATTRLGNMGIGVRPYLGFIAKAPAAPVIPVEETNFGGSTKSAKYKKKKWTEEELKGLEDYGKARLGITDEIEVAPIEEVAPNIAPEPEVAETNVSLEDLVSPEIQVTLEENNAPTLPEISILKPTVKEPEKVDDDILLIMALIETHLS